MEPMPFEGFPKMPRWNRFIVVTEKIDGTNAQVCITEDGQVLAGSRTRWITPEDDNHGFARWVKEHENELRQLGVGRHFGEWWGQGIQRGYGLKEKRFSLFNVSRWGPKRDITKWPEDALPACCHVVPILWTGNLCSFDAAWMLDRLGCCGSYAAPGFMQPEGFVIYHTAARMCFKMTLKNDEGKG